MLRRETDSCLGLRRSDEEDREALQTNFTKQSLPHKANCIWRLSPRGFVGDSMCISILSSQGCVFGKRSRAVRKRIIAIKSSRAARVNLPRWSCESRRRRAIPGSASPSRFSGQCVDRVFVPSVERGVQHACSEGVLAGSRVVDVNINFYDGKMHPVDSNDISFQVAGYWAFKETFRKARPSLLEPIHSLEIRVPEDCVGKVIGDLSSRRGKVVGMEAGNRLEVVRALAPARELYRYASQLRSLTGGRGLHTEEFSHYEELPAELEQQVIELARKARSNH